MSAASRYREGWERIFGGGKKPGPPIIEFSCALCNKAHLITDSFSWGLPKVPETLVSDKKDGRFYLRCKEECSIIRCAPCQNNGKSKKASHRYTYSKDIAMEDKNGKLPVSLLCNEHAEMFSRFSGSITLIDPLVGSIETLEETETTGQKAHAKEQAL
jgi:hypothetical protein